MFHSHGHGVAEFAGEGSIESGKHDAGQTERSSSMLVPKKPPVLSASYF